MKEFIEKIKSCKNQTPKDAILMILSRCADVGSESGVLISVKQFDKVADVLIEMFELAPNKR